MFRHNPIDLGYSQLECDTSEAGRFYVSPAGKRYPSITTVLSLHSEEFLESWTKRVGETEAKRVGRVAAIRGESVHSCVELHLRNEPVEKVCKMPNVMALFKSIKPVFDQRVNNIRLQETALWSDHLRVAGRLDLLADFDDELAVIDVKTSGRVKKAEDIETYFMQESGYAVMVEERTGIPVRKLVTVVAVDFHPPLIFIEKRDRWVKKLQNTVLAYESRKAQSYT